MKIYTRTGDAGDTGLFDGTRVLKSDPRVDAYGEVDELNAWLGLVRTEAAMDRPDTRSCEMLEQIQRDLFATRCTACGSGTKNRRTRVTRRP